MKHAGGRPSEYDPIFIDKLEDYLKSTGREQTKLPTVEGFAIFIGVSKKTLYNWSKEHDEFLHALDDLLTYQAEQLINDGIYGGKEVNATIVKLLLQNNHGMKERTDSTTDDKPIAFGNLTDEQLNQFINSKIGKDTTSGVVAGEGKKSQGEPA